MNKKSWVTKNMALVITMTTVLSSGAEVFADSVVWGNSIGAVGPSPADLDRICADIKYPNYTWMYLPEYIDATVMHKAVYSFKDPDSDVWRKGNYCTVYRGTEVTVLAISEGYACVILTGTRNASWINQDYLEENYSYTMDSVERPPRVPPVPVLPFKSQSAYGKSLQKNLIDGVCYSERHKANVVTQTYYDRHDARGNRQLWYTYSSSEDHSTGYRINYYYADGVLLFADAYIPGYRSSVTFYFWGNQLFACHDLRVKNSILSFIGETDYNRIALEFGDINKY